jgi:enoyl-CoA hydratase/carnithine racemase
MGLEVKSGAVEAETLVRLDKPESGIARITMNRPSARNALSRGLIASLHGAITELGHDAGVAAILLAGAGPVFSSGHDLKELVAHRQDADGGQAFFAATMSACSALMQTIVACPKPVIAAVEGTATAAGCQLVATCDLAVAAKSAHFATPGVNIGLFCSTPMVALSRNVSRKQAMEMLLLGDMLSADDAKIFGLVNRVVATAKVMDEALGMARTIAAKSKVTVAIGKQAFYAQAEMSLGDAYAYASEVMVKNMMAADADEGISAFLAKRPPEWKDR